MSKPSCACEHCASLCGVFPGWLTPRDVRRLARHLGVTEASLFATHLALDTYDAWDRDIVIAVPANERAPAGKVYPRVSFDWTPSPCAMLRDGRCTIHAAKPRECRDAYSKQCETRKQHGLDAFPWQHSQLAHAWGRPGVQQWLAGLLREAGVSHPAFDEQAAA